MTTYDELYVYSMGRPNFILQLVADANTAQNATAATKPIGVVFSLVGLYLRVEKGFTGKQIQDVHRRLARQRKQWPLLQLPTDRGVITAADVMAAAEGPSRDLAIDAWCKSVWDAYGDCQRLIVELLGENGVI